MDDVDVQVHHRLPGGLPDVVAVGVEPFVEEVFCVPEEGGEFRVEEVRDVPEGDDEEVAGARGVPVNSGRSRGRFARTISSAGGCRTGRSEGPCLVPPDVD